MSDVLLQILRTGHCCGSGLYDLSVTGDLPPGLSIEMGSGTVAFVGVSHHFRHLSVSNHHPRRRREPVSKVTSQFRYIPAYWALHGSFLRPANVTDTEIVTVHDVPSVFFPIVLIDDEIITTERRGQGHAGFLSKLSTTEVVTTTDSVAGQDAAEAAVNETITTTDAITVVILTVPRIYWTTPARPSPTARR